MGLIWSDRAPATRVGAPRRLRERGRVSPQDGSGPLIDGLLSQVGDIDSAETQEWLESLEGLIDDRGGPRARYSLLRLARRAKHVGVTAPAPLTAPYVDPIGVHDGPYYPGDAVTERK